MIIEAKIVAQVVTDEYTFPWKHIMLAKQVHEIVGFERKIHCIKMLRSAFYALQPEGEYSGLRYCKFLHETAVEISEFQIQAMQRKLNALEYAQTKYERGA